MKILDVAPYSIFPPKSGGPIRIHNMNLKMSEHEHVLLFSQGLRKTEIKFPIGPYFRRFNDNYIQYRYTDILSLPLNILLGSKRIPPIFSGNVLKLVNPKILNKALLDHDIFQIEHPWQFSYIYSKNFKKKPIVLVEHNIESYLLSKIVNIKLPYYKKLLRLAKKIERFAVENSDIIFVTSSIDAELLKKIYKVGTPNVFVIPNGVDISKFSPACFEEKQILKEKLGFSGKTVILFAGGVHKPNFDALNEIINMSTKLKRDDLVFLIAGGVGAKYKNNENLIFTGFVDDITTYFRIADIAINPMMYGSGTNLKMLEYLASGIPTITTSTGSRGIDVRHNREVIISPINDFVENIKRLVNSEHLSKNLSHYGRKLAVEKYDWDVIAEKQINILRNSI